MLCHLIGVSMNPDGEVIKLFTTNRWVTGETWFDAGDVIAMLDRFDVAVAQPSWPSNRWLTSVLRLFRPQIIDLVRARDRKVADWARAHPDRDVFEDRELEITSELSISLERQVDAVRAALADAHRSASAG